MGLANRLWFACPPLLCCSADLGRDGESSHLICIVMGLCDHGTLPSAYWPG